MAAENESKINDLLVAAIFIRSIDTGQATLNFELKELADQLEKIVLEYDMKQEKIFEDH